MLCVIIYDHLLLALFLPINPNDTISLTRTSLFFCYFHPHILRAYEILYSFKRNILTRSSLLEFLLKFLDYVIKRKYEALFLAVFNIVDV